MKALSIREPWATAIWLKKKAIETRTWYTAYRGPLLICAAKTIDEEAIAHVAGAMDYPISDLWDFCETHRGNAIARARLVDCRPMRPTDESGALCTAHPSLFAWVLQDVQDTIPFPVKGRLGLFDVETPA
ncbi:ASCH domain-containing protein [bacterium]|nr:ASCH domain-containing protein [bacterium]